MRMRRMFCGLALLMLAGCSGSQDLLSSVPLIGTAATPGAPALQTLDLEGAVLTLPLENWAETERQKTIEGSLFAYERKGSAPETLDIQALRAHAGTPVMTFANGLQNNIRDVCINPSLTPLTRRQLGSVEAVILRFSCQTQVGARGNGGLEPYEAGLYVIVPTDRAMLVIQRAWSGAARPDDFPVLTLRPDWKEFLDTLSIADPAS